jgi:hypothetical protein
VGVARGFYDLAAVSLHCVTQNASWRASASFIASGCSSYSRVEFSMSVNKKVTVPAGNALTELPSAPRTQ